MPSLRALHGVPLPLPVPQLSVPPPGMDRPFVLSGIHASQVCQLGPTPLIGLTLSRRKAEACCQLSVLLYGWLAGYVCSLIFLLKILFSFKRRL